jgi:hypothetical protein
MDPETRAAIRRGLGWMLLINSIAAALAIGFGIYRGWTSMGQYGQGLIFAGAIVAGIGVISLASQSQMTGDARTLYIQERALGDVNAINKQNHLDRLQAFSSMIFLGTAGLLLAVIGVILQSLG